MLYFFHLMFYCKYFLIFKVIFYWVDLSPLLSSSPFIFLDVLAIVSFITVLTNTAIKCSCKDNALSIGH